MDKGKEFYHCYQRPKDRGVIFYTVTDHLLYFTIYCTVIKQFHVTPLKLVQMPDHLHHSIMENEHGQLSACLDLITSLFVREYNSAYSREGPMFERRFGRAAKKTDKSIRTNLTYLNNNPVERQLVTRAECYRWNYLAYAVSDHPFSRKIMLRKASMPLRRALKIVEYQHNKGRYLTGKLLRHMFDSLPNDDEREQLTDFIVSKYSVIDHEAASGFFQTYENQLITASANTGNEYDIKENFIGRSDACYAKMTRLLMESGKVKDIHEVYAMRTEEKWNAYNYLKARMNVPSNQVKAFLHLPIKQD